MKFTIKDKDLKTIAYKFPNKKEEELYVYVCNQIWGGAPVEVDWAINTKIYKNNIPEI
jgi:hypothetical protein